MDAAIVAEDLRKSYGETVALDAVSLSVEAGEVFGLVGPNGAGKTTLVRSLTGTAKPDGGSAQLLGAPPAAAARERVGLLPQQFRPHERLTARELVGYYRGLYDDGRDPDAVLADVGLAEAADTLYADLSGGQQRRACVGMALVNDPELLFLDEPTTGIDPVGRRAVWSLVEELAAGGATVFLTTHDMDEAHRLADRVGLLEAGDHVAVGSPSALITEHGGAPRLHVETDAGPPTLLGGEYVPSPRPGGFVVEGVQPADIGEIVDAMDRAGLEYEALRWTEPDLEDVYLALTGDQFEAAAGRRTDPGAATGGDR